MAAEAEQEREVYIQRASIAEEAKERACEDRDQLQVNNGITVSLNAFCARSMTPSFASNIFGRLVIKFLSIIPVGVHVQFIIAVGHRSPTYFGREDFGSQCADPSDVEVMVVCWACRLG